jgi:hypothetical protein
MQISAWNIARRIEGKVVIELLIALRQADCRYRNDMAWLILPRAWNGYSPAKSLLSSRRQKAPSKHQGGRSRVATKEIARNTQEAVLRGPETFRRRGSPRMFSRGGTFSFS